MQSANITSNLGALTTTTTTPSVADNSSANITANLPFKVSGVTWRLVAMIGFKSLVCLAGLLLNMSIVYVTVKTKTLRSACNVQIAMNALSIVFQNCSVFVTFAVVVTGTNFIPLYICAIIQFFPLFCTMLTNASTLSIGIDRLLSVIFPIWYMVYGPDKLYLYAFVAACALYSSVVPIVALNISLHNPMIPVMCVVMDPAQKAANWVVIMLLVVNFSAVCCYILVWLVIICGQSMAQKQKNTFKSLSMILVLEVFGWVTNYFIRLVLQAADMNGLALTTWYIVNIAAIVPYITMSIAPFVLFGFSSEYRRALLRQLPAKLCARIVPQQMPSSKTGVTRYVSNAT